MICTYSRRTKLKSKFQKNDWNPLISKLDYPRINLNGTKTYPWDFDVRYAHVMLSQSVEKSINNESKALIQFVSPPGWRPIIGAIWSGRRNRRNCIRHIRHICICTLLHSIEAGKLYQWVVKHSMPIGKHRPPIGLSFSRPNLQYLLKAILEILHIVGCDDVGKEDIVHIDRSQNRMCRHIQKVTGPVSLQLPTMSVPRQSTIRIC